MLGTIIEDNGDRLDDSHIRIGWPLFIDGAVRQCCVHRKATVQELEDMLQAYNMKETRSKSTVKHPNGPIMQCGTASTWSQGRATRRSSCGKNLKRPLGAKRLLLVT